MAFHTFLQEGVDTAVIECGIGGEPDSTNIIEKPTVTGITSLGIDHTAVLGNTIEEIAWHKGGIMKDGAAAFTAPQPPAALSVLRERAAEKRLSLQVAEYNPAIEQIQLGLSAEFQKTNASLAISIVYAHLAALRYLPPEFCKGLEEVRWPGRCEIRRNGNIAWHIDGGHTLESIRLAGLWFAQEIQHQRKKHDPATRVLLFNQQTRDANALAQALHQTLALAQLDDRPFTHAVFCTNTTFKDKDLKPDIVNINGDAKAIQSLKVQQSLAQSWKSIEDETIVEVRATIQEAVEWVEEIAQQTEDETVMALVTGSLHLVGGFLDVLETRNTG